MRDIETWAFSDAAPWEVEIERLAWRGDMAVLREQTKAAVPQLVRPRTLPPLWRFAAVFHKTGRLPHDSPFRDESSRLKNSDTNPSFLCQQHNPCAAYVAYDVAGTSVPASRRFVRTEVHTTQF